MEVGAKGGREAAEEVDFGGCFGLLEVYGEERGGEGRMRVL